MTQQSSSNSGRDLSAYDVDSIVHLDPREHVRKRPGMYFGGTDVRALNGMLYEVMLCILDDVIAGTCNKISVTLLPDNVVVVEDNAPGITVIPLVYRSASTLEFWVAMKFTVSRGMMSSAGLYGVGIMFVNALCETCRVDVRRDGGHYRQEYREGIAQGPVTRIGDAAPDERGNTFTFRPDFTIMDHVDFDAEGIVERGKVLAATFPGLQVTVTDQRGDEAITTTLHAPNGMTDYLAQWVMPNDAVGEIQVASGSYPIADKGPTVDVQVALQWRETMATEIIAFASGFETPDHGTHVNGFKRWLDEQNDIQPLGANGYTAVVSVIHPDPQFESQTRIKLMNLEAADAVYSVLSDQLGKGSA